MQLLWPELTNPPELLPDEAHAWAVRLVLDEAAWQALWATLSTEERERAKEFRFDEPRRKFVAARGTLRTLLGKYLNEPPDKIEITLDDRGKPRLGIEYATTNVQFNLSHSGDLALIVMATGCEVGIDVEQVRDVSKLEQIARRYFHPAEVEAILSTATDARNDAFLRCWTMKEAVLKAYGLGIAKGLDAFQVPLSDPFEGWLDLSMLNLDHGSQCWVRQIVPSDGYVAAVACVGSQCRVRCFAFPA